MGWGIPQPDPIGVGFGVSFRHPERPRGNPNPPRDPEASKANLKLL